MFALLGCSQRQVAELFLADNTCEVLPKKVKTPSQEILEYLKEFSIYASSYGRKCFPLKSIRIEGDRDFYIAADETVDTAPKIVGLCNFFKGEIYLKKSFWDGSLHPTKKALMFHELGHCVLGLPHKRGINIMNPNLLPNYLYEVGWSPLINDFFVNQQLDFFRWAYEGSSQKNK